MQPSPFRVGIDLVSIRQIQDSLANFGTKFLQRIFTPGEQEYCTSLASAEATTQSLAARFAAKEATIKILRPDATDALDWYDIEVHRHPQGSCEIILHGEVAARAHQMGIVALSLSLSHEGEYAIAVVLADFA
jgi:holo-[acyl-carrier protein] synthase